MNTYSTLIKIVWKPRNTIAFYLLDKDSTVSEYSQVFLIWRTMQMSLLSSGANSAGKLVLQSTFFYPEKILQEIDSAIGPSQTPCMADLDKMPYTDAVIHEIHRSLALLPLNLPRAVILSSGSISFPRWVYSCYI